MYVLMVGLNHRTAPVEIRERFSICGADLQNAYQYFNAHEDLEGTVVLATCNRTEIYATARDIEKGMRVLENFLEEYSGINYDLLKKNLYQPNCYNAILHLFRVASGLDSMILGESQIISQVKEAYQQAVEANASDVVLNALFQRAIYVGKKVRTDTGIDSNCVSVSYAAVEMARNELGTLEGKTVLVVGAGEMGELATKYLLQNGIQSVIVSNRSYDRAISMAASFNGRAVRFDELAHELLHADIVISCTAANHYVLKAENCKQILAARNGKKIMMIDIAVPRDIDPILQETKGVALYDIDDLQGVVDNSFLERQKAADVAEGFIIEELDKFNEWLASLYVVPVVASLKRRGESIKQNELRKALNRLGDISEHDKKILGTMANSITNQILHLPIVTLKEMAVSNQGHLYAEVVKKLFALQIDSEENEKYEQIEVGDER